MKKITCILFVAFISLAFSNIASAQISVGGGLAFGTEVEELGIQAGGVYTINEEFRAGADFIYYLTSDDNDFGGNFTWWEFNANGHYLFVTEEDMIVYALAGLNFASFSYDFPGFEGFGGGSVSNTEVGLNVGAGLEYGLGFADLYAELKYALSSADQLVLSAGLRFPIN
jgi:opacity protein-like surface antigen